MLNDDMLQKINDLISTGVKVPGFGNKVMLDKSRLDEFVKEISDLNDTVLCTPDMKLLNFPILWVMSFQHFRIYYLHFLNTPSCLSRTIVSTVQKITYHALIINYR